MNKYKWDLGQSSRLDSFGRFFDSLFNFDLDDVTVSKHRPDIVVNITTKDELAIVDVELAGWNREDLALVIEGSIITISGERDNIGFNKTFRVNTEHFDMDSVKAGYKNGLLTITLARIKKAETEKRTVIIQ